MPKPKLVPDGAAAVPPEILLVLRELSTLFQPSLRLIQPGTLAYTRLPQQAANITRMLKRAQGEITKYLDAVGTPPRGGGNGHPPGGKG